MLPRKDYYGTNILLPLGLKQIHHRRWIQVAMAAVIFPHRLPCFKRHQDQVRRQRQRQTLAVMQKFTLVAAGRFQIDAEETRQAAQIPLNRAAIFNYIPAAGKDEGGIAPVLVIIRDGRTGYLSSAPMESPHCPIWIGGLVNRIIIVPGGAAYLYC